MADMAEMALDNAMLDEMYLDDYCHGDMSMEEAYDHGFIDVTGTETKGVQQGWDRVIIGGRDTIDKELELAVCHLESTEEFMYQGELVEVTTSYVLNQQAIDNLKKELPTCNYCAESMTAREGKFGKFYFCGNYCKGQKTVGDAYWQSVRKK